MSDLTWDVFVSHNRVNKPWVRQLVKQWRDLGVRVFFDEDSIDPGEDVIHGIERGLSDSRHVVLFLSPGAIASRWVALEASLTLYADPDAMERRLIPVVLEPIDSKTLRPAIARLNRIDLTDPFSRLERYKYLCKFLNISASSFPSQADEIYISISSLGTADPVALRLTRYAIRALTDIGPMMQGFGPHDGLNPDKCLERLPGSSVHILVFPERASRASDEAVERATAEYEQAKRNNIEVLAYVPSEYRMISTLPLRRLYEDVRSSQSLTNIKCHYRHDWPEDFGRHIARDLDRIAQSTFTSDTLGSNSALAAQHERVLEQLYKANLDSAEELNERILATHAESPRAHYNQACIDSWRVEHCPHRSEELLHSAKRHFEKAIEFGIVCLIALRSDGSVMPKKVVAENPALQSLFHRFPDLQTVDDEKFFGPKRLGGGCIDAGVAISLPNGRDLPSSRLRIGDRVTSWNSFTQKTAESSVCRRVPDIVPELLIFNHSLRVTPTQPVLVSNEWKTAADIKIGDVLHQASGENQKVVSIERLRGRFFVFDFSVDPHSTLIAAGFIVHNK
jgi:hypothetical protein